MRMVIVAVGVSLALAASAPAQRRSYGAGFGNIVFPGTGGPPARIATPALRTPRAVAPLAPSAHVGRLGSRGGYGAIIPYAVPVYVGGYGYDPYYAAPQPQPVYVQAPPQQSPTVIINQYYTPEKANPVVRDYTENPPPPPATQSYQAPERPNQSRSSAADDRPTIYLIAYKDQSIHAAVGYWIEDGTLNYVTPQGSYNRASVELIDKAFSEQLNRERGLEFELDFPK